MKKILIILLAVVSGQMVQSQSLPSSFRAEKLIEYNKLNSSKHEEFDLSFDEYFEMEKNYWISLNSVSSRSANNLCDNGTFESGQINTGDWGFYWRGVAQSGRSKKNVGIFQNCIRLGRTYPAGQQVHHKVQSIGADDFSPINKVWSFPTGNQHSLRLGNAHHNHGREYIHKRNVLVTTANCKWSFSYALVMNDPIDHDEADKPYFQVKIKDGASLPMVPIYHNQLVDLGGGVNKIVSNNPLLQRSSQACHGNVVYKDWECVSVDMTSLIGRSVDLIFETSDCNEGGHFAYAYIDNLCVPCDSAPSQEGSIRFNMDQSDTCEVPGKICIDYVLPNGTNPSLEIKLNLIQNGVVLHTLNSGVLNSGSQYCFNLNSSNSRALNSFLKGFDFQIIATPKIGSFVFAQKKLGSISSGIKSGNNNDYRFSCNSCCENQLAINKGTYATSFWTLPRLNIPQGMTVAHQSFNVVVPSSSPITQLRAVVTNAEYTSSFDECKDCHTVPLLQGSIVTSGFVSSGPPLAPTPNPWSNNTDIKYINYREAQWTSNGTNLLVGDQIGVNYIMPPTSEIPCCADSMKVCISMRYRDALCEDCELFNSCTTLPLENSKQSLTPHMPANKVPLILR